MSTWNKKNFSIYTSDERSALGLIEELGNQTNYNTEEIEKVKESDNKKVSHDEMNSIYKIDKNADFTGSWHGIKKPTASNEGLQATVEKIVEEDMPKISKMNKIDEIIYKIKTGEYKKFRFIGDSIGLGADATGYGEDPNGQITFNWYGDIHREPKRDVLSYVNLFRLCLQRLDPTTSLINSSISGRSIKEACQLRTGYVFDETGEDVIFIALSINDLHMTTSLAEYEESYQIFIDYIKEVTKAKEIILLTPTPVYLENDTSSSNYLKVRELVNSIIKVAEKNNLFYIDIFNMVMSEINRSTMNYYTFFNDDTVHPSNEGHYLLYLLLSNTFHLSLNDDNFYLDRLTRWSYPTLESGVSDLSSSATEYDRIKYTIKGKNKVILNGILTGASLNNSNQKLFTLNHVVAPKKDRLFNCTYNNNSGEKKNVVLKINTSGEVSIFGQIAECNWLNIDINYYI